MEKSTPNTAVYQKLTKKQARKEVFTKLSAAMADYKSRLDKKKFESNLKKASKLFAVQIAKASKNAPPAKPAKTREEK